MGQTEASLKAESVLIKKNDDIAEEFSRYF